VEGVEEEEEGENLFLRDERNPPLEDDGFWGVEEEDGEVVE